MTINDLYISYFDPELTARHYQSDKDHLEELFAFLDMCLTVVFSAEGIKINGAPDQNESGKIDRISVSYTDLDHFLGPRNKKSERRELSDKAYEQISIARDHIMKRIEISSENDMIPRFEALRHKFDLDEFETFCLMLAFAPQYDRKYEGVFSKLHNNTSDVYATKWLAARLYEIIFGEFPRSAAAVLDGSSYLCRFLCIKQDKKLFGSGSCDQLVVTERIASYLLGDNEIDSTLKEYCEETVFDSRRHIPFRNEISEKLLYYILKKGFRDKGCFAVGLYGPDGIGRSTAACKAASVLDMSILKIRLDRMIKNVRDLSEKLDHIYTECQLKGALPCFYAVRKQVTLQDDDQKNYDADDLSYKAAAKNISEIFRFVFWFTYEKDDSFSDTEAERVSIEMPILTANERYMFWKEYLDLSDSELMSYANRYILTPKQIRDSARLARLFAASEKMPLSEDHIVRSVRQHSVNQLGSLASKINAVFGWDDLIIGEDQKHRMKLICDQVRYRSIVNEDWGFGKKTPYGKGLCALFYGSPGTGKTMAVQVMANELGLELYRIDLSQLTSKYIGETQKNINRLFEKAKNINAMLFFDEADAMFAKRSEVKDSNDRYANSDTAYLLQKLEDHEGITILATNYINNIDDAFKRRIKFMINFVFPDPEVRLDLWKKILPSTAKTDENLDLEFFAEKFELSGSNIKEILTNAAFIAASQGTGIKNIHIIEAIKLNYSKYGKILTDADFDYLV